MVNFLLLKARMRKDIFDSRLVWISLYDLFWYVLLSYAELSFSKVNQNLVGHQFLILNMKYFGVDLLLNLKLVLLQSILFFYRLKSLRLSFDIEDYSTRDSFSI